MDGVPPPLTKSDSGCHEPTSGHRLQVSRNPRIVSHVSRSRCPVARWSYRCRSGLRRSAWMVGADHRATPRRAPFFHAYFRLFRAKIPGLPALIPEVWLHWDHKTIAQRGPEALKRFRMDFLLLLPNRIRVVLEIDGKQHYSDETGRAAPELYARMSLADRELKLAGYEVYHFGGHELPNQERADQVAQEFFLSLFERFGQSY